MSAGVNVTIATAKSALITAQKQMNVISNNVANADNIYYHRQIATLQSNPVVAGDTGYYGTGVSVAQVVRSYDQGLENSLKDSISDDAYKQAYAQELSEAENLLAPETTDTLGDAVSGFADAWQKVASTPEGSAQRTALLGQADSLASAFNTQYSCLTSIRDNIAANDATGDGLISDDVDAANALLERLPALNDQINNLESNVFLVQKANDLRDERDQIVKELSKYFNVTAKEESNYKYTVSLVDDKGVLHPLVDGNAFPTAIAVNLKLVMEDSTPSGYYTPKIQLDSEATTLDLGDTGEIQGLINARAYVVDQMTNIKKFAEKLVLVVNTQQQKGLPLDYNGTTPEKIFVFENQTASFLGMQVNPNIANNPDKIAACGGTTLQTGNGENAKAVWNLLNTNDTDLGGVSILNYSNSLLNTVSQDVSTAKNNATTSSNIKKMYQETVSQTSGISTDQEMTDMLVVQRAYQAAAKLMSVADQMMQTVLSIG